MLHTSSTSAPPLVSNQSCSSVSFPVLLLEQVTTVSTALVIKAGVLVSITINLAVVCAVLLQLSVAVNVTVKI